LTTKYNRNRRNSSPLKNKTKTGKKIKKDDRENNKKRARAARAASNSSYGKVYRRHTFSTFGPSLCVEKVSPPQQEEELKDEAYIYSH
jgi:hypothetical protein